MAGTLYVVATPVGNLEDLTPRARRVLAEADWIACEDTRRTGKLLARHGIEGRLLSCHRFNEGERLTPVLERLAGGSCIALVSDGGTPGIADPGAYLVRAALDAGFRVSPVPGPSVVAAALSASGAQADRFVFDGFLPHRAGQRRRRLRELRGERRTLVLLETPHRIRAALADIDEVLGERRIVLGRELTKLHEEIVAGTARSLGEHLGDEPVRGEIALVVEGASETQATDEVEVSRLSAVWRQALDDSGGDPREALRRAARALGVKRAELRRRLAEIGELVD